eukprot:CAMPEP_0172902376 /NCGR_PEP_ID=MMETSP1075-20121228/168270_1 /TAXON_ID=2916 /ORGANISM="Ceratium fusus, Strain PA161109" /LENGTH=71 /DNA_ID=CAMNT_0013758953 /DNA_START=55 /DNA_END=266 /DNA_ORIENTATION=+
METCHKLIERCRRENCYSAGFMNEFEIFYVELKEFFNAGGLEEKCQQMARTDKGGALSSAAEDFLAKKRSA